MKIRFTTNVTHAGKIYPAGDELNVSKDVAETFIGNKVAEDPATANTSDRDAALSQLRGKTNAELLQIIAASEGRVPTPAPNAIKAELIDAIMKATDAE